MFRIKKKKSPTYLARLQINVTKRLTDILCITDYQAIIVGLYVAMMKATLTNLPTSIGQNKLRAMHK